MIYGLYIYNLDISLSMSYSRSIMPRGFKVLGKVTFSKPCEKECPKHRISRPPGSRTWSKGLTTSQMGPHLYQMHHKRYTIHMMFILYTCIYE